MRKSDPNMIESDSGRIRTVIYSDYSYYYYYLLFIIIIIIIRVTMVFSLLCKTMSILN